MDISLVQCILSKAFNAATYQANDLPKTRAAEKEWATSCEADIKTCKYHTEIHQSGENRGVVAGSSTEAFSFDPTSLLSQRLIKGGELLKPK